MVLFKDVNNNLKVRDLKLNRLLGSSRFKVAWSVFKENIHPCWSVLPVIQIFSGLYNDV